ncbi:MAG: beta-N-acetylglucosaminidase domain-containing protein [Acidobacteriia bacterium]|nr:beta-N-acetylglucosaminidase domain-containing protein [Terriglobia bacterium]
MRIRWFAVILVVASALPAGASSPPGYTWAAIAPADLDARIQRQVEEMAARDQALVRWFHSTREAARFQVPRGGLTLELEEQKDRDSFEALLRQQAGEQARGLEPALAREGYQLSVIYPRGFALERIKIAAATAAGFHHALLRIPDLLRLPSSELAASLLPAPKFLAVARTGRSTTAQLADFPALTERGIVEGFYGTPWSHQDRIDMLRFAGRHGMNVFYYAPKDDPYHRKLWKEPYPPTELKRLGELVGMARTNFVDFCFAISPGLSMVYSSDADFAQLTNKLGSVGKLGVSCFALFLDDVPQELQDERDRARFKTLAEAHATLINKLYDHLKLQSAENRLVVTPTVYTNEWGSRDYIRELGAAVNPDVPIVWTGPQVASPEITVAQAREWGEYLRRKPLVWDNFPVNDGRAWRVHLGPIRGRDSRLSEVIRGLLSNPMNQPRASMIPLATVADYLWNPSDYSPERAWHEAIRDQYGNDGFRLLAPFLETYGDYWWDENVFTPLFSERRYAIDLPAIEQRLAKLEAALPPLRNRGSFENLTAEIAPLLARTRERLPKVATDSAFRRLADGKLLWRPDYDTITAPRLASPPTLDGDFGKWRSGPVYALDQSAQIRVGEKLWRGPDRFSLRVAPAWDDAFLYLGAEVTDPDLYQPFAGRGIEAGDVFILVLETAFRKNFASTRPTGDEYRLLFSPGDFSAVAPSIFSDEDYLPPRPAAHDYNREIKTAWKKTPSGFSGDIAIPVSYFDGGRFSEGYEIGVAFGAQKVLKPAGSTAAETELVRVVFSSKSDPLFPIHVDNPASYQRLVLVKALEE